MILAWLALAFVGGILVGAALPGVPVGVMAIAVLACCVAAGAQWARLRAKRARREPAPTDGSHSGMRDTVSKNLTAPHIALVFAAFAVGLARSPHSGPMTPSNLAYYNGQSVTIQGTIAAEPDLRDTGVNEIVSADHILVNGRNRLVNGLLMLHSPPSQALEYGRVVTLSGKLEGLPSAGGYRGYLESLGIGSRLDFPRVLSGGRAGVGWVATLLDLRASIESGINEWLPEPEAAFLIAITLGAHSASLGDLAPALVSTGLIHLIAISGIKVALMAGMLYQLGRLARREIALGLSLFGVWGYVLLTGLTASGTRSAIMWSLVFIATYLGRGTVAFVSLGVAGAAMVAFEPRLLWDIGFQLSFLGTGAIVLFTPWLLRMFRYVPPPFREAWCTTLAAQAGTLPIVLFGFHIFSWGGPLANMVALPFLPFAIVLGFVIGVLHAVPWAAAGPAAITYGLLHALIVFVRWIAPLSGSTTPSPASILTVAYYAALVGGGAFVFRRLQVHAPDPRRPARDLGIVAACAIVFVAPLVPAQARVAPRLDVLGSGNSMLLQSGSRVVLIDGSPRQFDLLERLGQVLPYPARSIDLIVVTDPRAGNVAGLRGVLTHYRVGRVLDVGVEYPSSTYAAWRADCRSRRIPVDALWTGASVRIGSVSIRVLGPDGVYPRPQDSAGMLRITGPDFDVLYAGAASRREQLESVFRMVRLRAGTLVIDGKQGLDRNFFRAVRPATIDRLAGHDKLRRIGP